MSSQSTADHAEKQHVHGVTGTTVLRLEMHPPNTAAVIFLHVEGEQNEKIQIEKQDLTVMDTCPVPKYMYILNSIVRLLFTQAD